MGSTGFQRPFGFSPEMVLATNAVIFLARRRAGVATVGELRAALRAADAELATTLETLLRGGLVETEGDRQELVRLARPSDDLTLADVARATGDWLVPADPSAQSNGRYPGLAMALREVRRGLLADLGRARVSTLAGLPC